MDKFSRVPYTICCYYLLVFALALNQAGSSFRCDHLIDMYKVDEEEYKMTSKMEFYA